MCESQGYHSPCSCPTYGPLCQPPGMGTSRSSRNSSSHPARQVAGHPTLPLLSLSPGKGHQTPLKIHCMSQVTLGGTSDLQKLRGARRGAAGQLVILSPSCTRLFAFSLSLCTPLA